MKKFINAVIFAIVMGGFIGDYLHEKLTPERQNLTIIHSRLMGIQPTKKYNQSIN